MYAAEVAALGRLSNGSGTALDVKSTGNAAGRPWRHENRHPAALMGFNPAREA
jgi:hypothetical protein